MDLGAYLDRIGHAGPVAPDVATLVALHRAHLLAIPYENLDVQLQRPLTNEPAHANDKIVRRGRGGWCYEMNGLFGAMLEAVGFQVTRLAGAANRELLGDLLIGNHLVLKVDIEGETWIADVGFGDGSLEPFPLREGELTVGGFPFRLEALDAEWWRFHNHPFGGAKSFDFTLAPADAELLAGRRDWLQYAPDSTFTQNLIAQRYRGEMLLQLRGRVFRQVTPAGVDSRLLASADELVAVLMDEFGLDVPEVVGLWPRVVARHDAVMAEAAAAQPA
jgi:N-hydroxyarylamine O-acetyltransferase